MKRLSMAVAGAAFTVSAGAIAPDQAVPLDFSFTTVDGATGSFTLDTDAPLTSDQANFGDGIRGLSYGNAVSNISFSSPQLNLSNATGDFELLPFPIPELPGTLSGVSSPSGCSTGDRFTCLINIAVIYSGNLSELPELSDDPNSYSIPLGVDLFTPTPEGDFQSIGREDIVPTSFQVRERVPESDSTLSVLAVAVASGGLLLKRKLNTKRLGRDHGKNATA